MLNRQPFEDVATSLMSKVKKGVILGYVCATTITTIHYLSTKVIGTDKAKKEIDNLLSLFDVAPVHKPVLTAALKANFKDFEDSAIHESALNVGANGIVTRNVSDFENAKIAVYLPLELKSALELQG